MKLRSERRKKIVELRQQGKTVAEISAILGIDKNNLNATLAHMRKRGTLAHIPHEEAVRRQKESVRKRGCDPQTIFDLHNKGLSQDAIALELKQRRGYVARVLNNVKKRKADAFRTKIIELYQRGLSYKSMALVLNVSLGYCAVTVNRLVKKGLLTHRKKTKTDEPKRAKTTITEGFTVLDIPDKPTRFYWKKNAPTQ